MDDWRGTPRVRELDLSECKVSSTVDGVNVMRGIKCSAAFFTFLRANLALSSAMIASPTSTPQLDPISAPADTSSLSSSKVTTPTLAAFTPTTPFKPSLNHNATTPDLIPLDDIPELSLEPLQTEDEQAEGLKLIADTVGGMRGAATVSIMSHPSCIVPFTAYLSLIYYSRYAIPGHFKVTACYTYGSVVVYIFLIWPQP
ncbi:hypothetical protein NQ176_g9472 [Zarea fungicola]|uniref:Uncharacterized protein n=1 Tax=Zarea fungicola TaxID=93591 RepID=A0ACC1MMJ0_9HYPO|nr:hypothetical protein NQ176_g9472 [Lecanicillium fungicola]